LFQLHSLFGSCVYVTPIAAILPHCDNMKSLRLLNSIIPQVAFCERTSSCIPIPNQKFWMVRDFYKILR